MESLQPFSLTGTLILQTILSFYYIYFIIRPLSEIEKISGKINYGYRLFVIRTIGVVILDFLDPTLSAFLDISILFTLSFYTVPQIKKELNYINKIDSHLAKYDEITDEDLTAQGIKNRKVLEDNLFTKLVSIQNARAKYDYETLKALCTEKLYNLYITELEMLHETGLDYHFEDYQKIESQIYSITSNEKEITIKLAIKASCISYRLSAEKEVVDGSKDKKTMIIHDLTFKKKIETNDIEENCKNCGAPTKRNVTGKCQYCNTIIDTESTDWILAQNKIILEKVIHGNE